MKAYIQKTWYYCKRNGIRRTFFAALERVLKINNISYEWEEPAEADLEQQRQKAFANPVTFSVLVPAYETDTQFLREMIDSLIRQTYPYWELVIADASKTDTVEAVVKEYTEKRAETRIVYKHLEENAGISANTNAALRLATGEYIGLLDHDDVLTPDALYEMAVRIEEATTQGKKVRMLYSDEDKCDMEMTHFYEPHFKEDFNLDLLLSNNYICHFLVMEAGLMKQIQFRSDFDGAQDYKLVLDAVDVLLHDVTNCIDNKTTAFREQIAHIPKVLYHWRCHMGSTAQNPQSKLYAYEAGKRAVASFCEKQGWKDVSVEHLPHLGFYKISYGNNADKVMDKKTETDEIANLLRIRADVGAVGGMVLHNGRIVGGICRENGNTCYYGLYHYFSGYMHKAVLMQEAYALDLRCITVRKELQPLLNDVKTKYQISDQTRNMSEEMLQRANCEFADMLRQKGYRMLWNPAIKCKV